MKLSGKPRLSEEEGWGFPLYKLLQESRRDRHWLLILIPCHSDQYTTTNYVYLEVLMAIHVVMGLAGVRYHTVIVLETCLLWCHFVSFLFS